MTRPTARVLALLELLQGSGQRTVGDLAARLRVDERTVRRYVEHLTDLGIPVQARRGRYGGYQLARGYKLPPLMLTDDEVTVFERADRQPTTGTGLGIWPAALKALDSLGLGEKARSIGRRQPSGAIYRPDGSRIAVVDVDRLERKQGEPVYLLSRPALLHLLAEALRPALSGMDRR